MNIKKLKQDHAYTLRISKLIKKYLSPKEKNLILKLHCSIIAQLLVGAMEAISFMNETGISIARADVRKKEFLADIARLRKMKTKQTVLIKKKEKTIKKMEGVELKLLTGLQSIEQTKDALISGIEERVATIDILKKLKN